MSTTSVAPAVYTAISNVAREMAASGIAKTRRNVDQKYQFRGIDDVYNALAPLLPKHGLVVVPRMLTRACAERATRSGGALFSVVVEAEFDFVAVADGSRVTARAFGEAMIAASSGTAQKSSNEPQRRAPGHAFAAKPRAAGCGSNTAATSNNEARRASAG